MLIQANYLELARRADAATTKYEFGRKVAEAHRVIAAMEVQHREIADMLEESHRIVEECRALLSEIDDRVGEKRHEIRDETGNCNTTGR